MAPWPRIARLWKFLLRERTRYVFSWLLAVASACACLLVGWTIFDDPARADGNSGHTQIDFGGQYTMGRMLVEGHAHHLYDRRHQREVLLQAYPKEKQNPTQEQSDVQNLMQSFMGSDDPEQPGYPLGGSLYPPIHAFLYYPLSLLPPQQAYRLAQILGIVSGFVAGLGIRQLSGGRIWWPIATAALIGYPGFGDSLNLGQNSGLTLTLLVWGWFLLSRGRECPGGVVWGLLAFKPVWAAAFFLVPLWTGRWRACLAMLGTGLVVAGATLPVVSWTTWHDWLRVSQEATATYETDFNWIHLSRDLLSIPRRWFLNFEEPYWERRENLAAALAGWTMLLGVLELTTRLAVIRREQALRAAGAPAACLLLGAWLCCFHFMYYDVLLTMLPFFLLMLDPWRFLQPLGWAFRKMFRRPDVMPARLILPELLHTLVVLTSVVALVTSHYLANLFGGNFTPWETICVVPVWLWCGWHWARTPVTKVNAGPVVREGLAPAELMPCVSGPAEALPSRPSVS